MQSCSNNASGILFVVVQWQDHQRSMYLRQDRIILEYLYIKVGTSGIKHQTIVCPYTVERRN